MEPHPRGAGILAPASNAIVRSAHTDDTLVGDFVTADLGEHPSIARISNACTTCQNLD